METSELEKAVIEAAVAKRKAELAACPGGVHLSTSRYAFESHIRAEEEACDELIALREKVELDTKSLLSSIRYDEVPPKKG